MKLGTDDRTIERSTQMVETGFTIKATSKAFSILSSGLYSDKILAIVRELSCNAYDSHIAAGKASTPIEVKLPSSLDPMFYVKDFGTGLSHDDVIGLYTTYFESTKSDSNDFIGALGLGSKSPFSYVNSFNVESRFNGTKMVYTAFINEQGVPSITKLGEGPTNEANGMTISLAAKRDDVNKFTVAARRAFMYFDPQPNVKGDYNPNVPSYTTSGTNWKVRKSDSHVDAAGARVVQGVVAYPIDTAILRTNGVDGIGSLLMNLPIDLFVDIGEVEVAASREALSYTKHTITNLTRALEKVADEYSASIQKEFDACASLFDALLLYTTKMRRSSPELYVMQTLTTNFANDLFTYKGTSLAKSVNISIPSNLLSGMKISIYGTSYRRYSKSDRVSLLQSIIETDTDPSLNLRRYVQAEDKALTIVIDDVGSRNVIRSVALQNPNTMIVAIGGATKRQFDIKKVNKILAAIGNPSKTILASTVAVDEKIPVRPSTYKAKKTNEVFVWKGFPLKDNGRRSHMHRVFSRLCWKNETIDLNDGGVFVPVERFTIASAAGLYFDEIVKAIYTFGGVTYGTPIYGLNEKQMKVIDRSKWTNAFDLYNKLINDNRSLFERSIAAESILTAIPDEIRKRFLANWDTTRDQFVDGPFKTYLDMINSYVSVGKALVAKFGHAVELRTISSLTSYANKKVEVDMDKLVRFAKSEYAKILSQYEMLTMINWYSVSSSNQKVLIKYVNTVSAEIAAMEKAAA